MEGINDDNSSKSVEVYTLGGLRIEFAGDLSGIDTLPAGMYVVKSNGRVYKRMVR